jgi:hypothetical protein
LQTSAPTYPPGSASFLSWPKDVKARKDTKMAKALSNVKTLLGFINELLPGGIVSGILSSRVI